MRRILLLLLIVLLPVMLVACGGGDDANGNGDNTGDAGDDTGDTASEPEALELTQEHTTENGIVTFSYPSDWFVYEDLNIPYIYSNEDAQSRLGGRLAFESGHVMMQITRNALPNSLYGNEPAEHITKFMEGLVDSLNMETSEAGSVTIGDMQAASALATGEQYDMWGIALPVADDMMLEVLAYTAPGEFAQHELTIIAIVESIVYTP